MATSMVVEALEVEYESLIAFDAPLTLCIPNNQIPHRDILGMKWYLGDLTGKVNALALRGVDSNSGRGRTDGVHQITIIARINSQAIYRSQGTEVLMSTDELDHLEFRGTDLKECEHFITAVTKHARAQGKLRDDQWIADFVAICLTGDALIWWSLLDEETQKSWRLLRQAMITTFRPLFYGKSGAEAEDFVSQVRKRALHVGKLYDQRWVAGFASECFVGSALRWYMSLDSGVREDWFSLQQAIFAQYGQGFEESSPIIPVPAPAATAPVANNGRRRGRIRVFREGDSEIYYLSKVLGLSPNLHGRLNSTTSVANALEVECESLRVSDGPQNLLIPDNQIQGFDVLGLKWLAADLTVHSSCLAICGVNSTSGAATLDSQFRGPTLTKAWKVSQSEDGRVAISALNIIGSGERLHLYFDGAGYRWVLFRPRKGGSGLDSELLFEPI